MVVTYYSNTAWLIKKTILSNFKIKLKKFEHNFLKPNWKRKKNNNLKYLHPPITNNKVMVPVGINFNISSIPIDLYHKNTTFIVFLLVFVLAPLFFYHFTAKTDSLQSGSYTSKFIFIFLSTHPFFIPIFTHLPML